MAKVRWTKTIEITFESEIDDEELVRMIDAGTYADDLAEYEDDNQASEYAVTDREFDPESLNNLPGA